VCCEHALRATEHYQILLINCLRLVGDHFSRQTRPNDHQHRYTFIRLTLYYPKQGLGTYIMKIMVISIRSNLFECVWHTISWPSHNHMRGQLHCSFHLHTWLSNAKLARFHSLYVAYKLCTRGESEFLRTQYLLFFVLRGVSTHETVSMHAEIQRERHCTRDIFVSHLRRTSKWLTCPRSPCSINCTRVIKRQNRWFSHKLAPIGSSMDANSSIIPTAIVFGEYLAPCDSGLATSECKYVCLRCILAAYQKGQNESKRGFRAWKSQSTTSVEPS